MDAGTVAEIAPPSALLADPASSFSRLVDRTGAASAAALRQMAADFFRERQAGIQVGRFPRPSFDNLRRASLASSVDAARHGHGGGHGGVGSPRGY